MAFGWGGVAEDLRPDAIAFAQAGYLAVTFGYAPIEDIGRCERVAKLFIIAENDEVVKSGEHSLPAYERATGVKKLVTVKGVGHTEIRSQKRPEAQMLAIDWFDEHLKKPAP